MTQSQFKAAAIKLHRQLAGKLAVRGKVRLTRSSLAKLYTPGVGAMSTYLKDHPQELAEYTIKSNSVAIISDGSALLGLGNTGAGPALPVMEGKALLMRELAGIDAYPIVLSTQEPAAIIATISNIATGFGAINLEDIAAPQCFAIEAELKRTLDIPVVHDDQHATAIAVLAGLINAFKVVSKPLIKSKVVIIGAGAAGSGVAHLLHDFGIKNLLVTDRRGIISPDRPDLNAPKRALLKVTNPERLSGDVTVAMKNADVVVGVSTPGAFTKTNIGDMNPKPIVFALANPTPEIMPTEAKQAGAAVIATGRSDFANQINNVLVFPGLFRGLLDSPTTQLTSDIKIAAAQALAKLVPKPTATKIMPTVFDRRVVPAIRRAVLKST